MAMTLAEFRDWALAQGSVAKYDTGDFKGECVSLINQYCYRVLDVPAKGWGNAKDWATNTPQRQYFDVLPASTPLQSGDIVVYGSNFGGGFGHIEIVLSPNEALGQNRSFNGRVVRGGILGGYVAVLRRKGGMVMRPSRERVIEAFNLYSDKPATEKQISDYMAAPETALLNDLLRYVRDKLSIDAQEVRQRLEASGRTNVPDSEVDVYDKHPYGRLLLMQNLVLLGYEKTPAGLVQLMFRDLLHREATDKDIQAYAGKSPAWSYRDISARPDHNAILVGIEALRALGVDVPSAAGVIEKLKATTDTKLKDALAVIGTALNQGEK